MFQLPGATFIQGGMSIPDSRVTFEIRVFQQKKDEVCHSFLVDNFTKSLFTHEVMVSLSYLLINAFFTEFILNSKNETTEHIIWLPSLHVIRIRASKGRDVPGQSGTGRPVVPLSGNKNISLSHRPSVPGQGQEQKSRDKLLCTGTK